MRARTILALAVLFLTVGARPALAADGPIVFQRDGTFFYSIHAELQGSAESSDSTEAPKLAAIAGGASLAGLAAYFIASNGGNDGLPGTPGLPAGNPGGVIIPPQQQAPGLPNSPIGGSGGTGGTGGTTGTNGTFTGPVTTAPEPVTMTLLATGLAGLGAGQLRRRRRG